MARKLLAPALLAILANALANAGDTEPEFIARRIAQIKPTAAPAWTKVAWTASLLEARRIGQEEHRPVFLFSYEGNLDTGRC